MNRDEAAAILRTQAHHPTVRAIHLQKRVCRGVPLQDALMTPVMPHPKRWASIGEAIDQYLQRQEREP